MYFKESRMVKEERYKEIVQCLVNRGFQVKLHIFQMGARGYMPLTTMQTLKDLGLKHRGRLILYAKLAKLMIRQAHALIKTRRQLESKPSKKATRKVRAGMATANLPLHHASGKQILNDAHRLSAQLSRAAQQMKAAPPGRPPG